MSKTKLVPGATQRPLPAAQAMLDADLRLRAAADAFGEDESDETLRELREASIEFADAWRACEER